MEDTLMKLKILFDADMFCYSCASSVERPVNWGDGLWTLHAFEDDATNKFDSVIRDVTTRVLDKLNWDGEYEIVMCFSDSKNFRKDYLPTYKLARGNKSKPVVYYPLKEWIENEYDSISIEYLEADDVLGIMATDPNETSKIVIVSGDKDMKTIPTTIYNFLQDTLITYTEDESKYWHLYQTLVGDVTDGYSGCPSFGDKTTRKLLDVECSWEAVEAQYIKKGLTAEDALVQARVAKILHYKDYQNGSVIDWLP